MNKKNLPHIPLYIGDWEKDCNILSCAAEGAWFRIVRKLFTKGKQSSIKMPTKSLQNLWSMSELEMNNVLEEFKHNDICEVSVDEPFVEITCRRYLKENTLSDIRSKARLGKQNNNKSYSKHLNNLNNSSQNADSDSDRDNDNDNKVVFSYDTDTEIYPTFTDFFDLYDKKKNKHKSEIAWSTLSYDEKVKAVEYIPAYIEVTPQKRYRLDPLNFIENKGWENEIIKNDNDKKKKGYSASFKQSIIDKVQP